MDSEEHTWKRCFSLDHRTTNRQGNRPFPSSLVPLFQNESKCETFHMKISSACSFIFMQIIFRRMVSHLHSLSNRATRELGTGLLWRSKSHFHRMNEAVLVCLNGPKEYLDVNNKLELFHLTSVFWIFRWFSSELQKQELCARFSLHETIYRTLKGSLLKYSYWITFIVSL